ncbi:MAG TPA: Gfo/Idh/MocA family oxidoreductase [Anaeromyxobacteraceae bacterium]|nr:Gfo/Idh/MocA family oxidoreductase [Anaeromyxobacteraceae bacterium]
MGERRFRVGLIGTSWWADLEHLPGLRSRRDVEVAALCGRDPGRLAALAARHGVPATFTDWREMIARAGLDVVVIATPNALHHAQALAAVEAGQHVICEKPLALGAGQAREMAARAEARGLRTLVFFTHRAVAAAAHVKRLLEEGFLGTPLSATALYQTASQLRPGKPFSWKMARAEAGTGALGDIGSHLVDLVRWWLGDFERVVAQWQTLPGDRSGGAADADDACAFLARLACGARAVFQATKLVHGRGNYQHVELHGTAASLVYEADPGNDPGWLGRVLAGRPGQAGLVPLPPPADLAAGLEGPDEPSARAAAYRRLTDPFFAAVARGGRAAPDFADGAAVQAVLDAVALSAEAGRWIEVG